MILQNFVHVLKIVRKVVPKHHAVPQYMLVTPSTQFSGSWLVEHFKASQKIEQTPLYNNFQARYSGFSKSNYGPLQVEVVTGRMI